MVGPTKAVYSFALGIEHLQSDLGLILLRHGYGIFVQWISTVSIMADTPQVAPVLSTPDTHIFEAATPSTVPLSTSSDTELDERYEISRTIDEISRARYQRIALQFPDHLLPDAPRVYARLQEGLRKALVDPVASLDTEVSKISVNDSHEEDQTPGTTTDVTGFALSILGDTSYGACCVDEVAAQHASADVVVHYGRACLSPTSHLPAIHIFTVNSLPSDPVIESFKSVYTDKQAKIILTSDVTYTAHLPALATSLKNEGYSNLFTTTVKHEPTSLIPNRTVPTEDATDLATWSLFHIGEPPQALLLTLASRVSQVQIYPATPDNPSPATPLLASTSLALRRRYALLTRVSRAPIIGILINTLSVHAYLAALTSIQDLIARAGKKYYVFVMGKLNAAKIANFAEVGGWVVVGCWESSLVESGEFEKPVVVPWELELALKGDEERVWTGEWRGDFARLLEQRYEAGEAASGAGGSDHVESHAEAGPVGEDAGGSDSESESEPPEFDLRTGKYIQHSKPMRQKAVTADKGTGTEKTDSTGTGQHSMVKRAKGDIARIGGEASPGAQFLREKRTWQGLGSDFEIAYDEDSSQPAVQEGRSGIARGYENERDKA